MRRVALFLAAIACAGCASTPGDRSQGQQLASYVERDAVRLNEAHTRTINAVIAIKILRARDNLPTGYTTLTGITYSPEIATGANIGLGPLGLGNPTNPFGDSDASFSVDEGSAARFSVNPFAEERGGSGLFKIEASEELFERYVESGWPIEVVFPLFIRRATLVDAPTGAAGRSADLEATCDIFGDHDFSDQLKAALDPQTLRTQGRANPACDRVVDLIFRWSAEEDPDRAAVRFVYDTLSNYACDADSLCIKLSEEEKKAQDQAACVAAPAYIQDLIASGDEALQGRIAAIEGASGKRLSFGLEGARLCDRPKSEKALLLLQNDGRYERAFERFEFRAFNDMIYFLGETLRSGDALPVSQCKGAPAALFKINQGAPSGLDKAVQVTHAGRSYWALNRPEPGVSCSMERTGTVLSILSQILLLNQSEEFLEAPQSFLDR